MEQYIPLAIGGVILLFILSGVIWGLIRGLKKTAFRFGWILVITIVFFFVVQFITLGLMKMDITFLNITINEGHVAKSLNEVAAYLLSQIPDFGPLLTRDPETLNILLKLVSLLVNPFIFLLLFWLSKILLWPIWAILSRVLIKKRRPNGEKKKKYAWFGALVGLFLGMFVGTMTIMPIVGVTELITEVEASTSSQEALNEGRYDGYITEVGGGEFIKLIDSYNNSAVSKALKYTGIEFFSKATFAGLSTTTIDDKRITLKEEAKSAILAIDAINDFTKLNFKNLTQEQINKIISTTRNLIERIYKVEIIEVMGNNLLPLVIDEILENPRFIVQVPNTGNATLNDSITDGLKDLKNVTFSDIRRELLNILDVAQLLNDKNLIVKVLNKEETNVLKIVKLLDSQTVDTIADKFASSKLLTTLMPVAFDTSILFAANYLDITEFEVDGSNVTAQEFKDMFKTVVTTAYAINNSLDLESKYYVTNTTLPLAGKVLDVVTGYKGLTEENYKLLINKAEEKVEEILRPLLSSLPADLEGIKNELLKAVYNVSEVESFEVDFTAVNNAFAEIMNIVENANTPKYKLNFKEVGKILDSANKTKLLGNIINPVIGEGLEYAKTKVPFDFADLKEVITKVKANVTKVTSWEVELDKLTTLINVAQDVFDLDDLKQGLLADDSNLLPEFGKGLDEAETSVLFGAEIKNIVKVIINQVEKFSIDNADMLADSVAIIKNNINTDVDINWEQEFTTLKLLVNKLMILADDTANANVLPEIGLTFDNIVKTNSVLVTREVINTILTTAFDQFMGDVDPHEADLLNIITLIKNEITTNEAISYKNELTALNSLSQNINNIDTETLNFEEFGMLLDSYDSVTGTTPSIVITKVRPNIVGMILNKVDTSALEPKMISVLDKIKGNVENIESYRSEFKTLENFIDRADTLATENYKTFDYVKFGEDLDYYGNSKLLGNVRHDIVEYMVDKIEFSDSSEFETATNEILEEFKLESQNVALGTNTYTNIFTEVQTIQDNLESLETITGGVKDAGYTTKNYGKTINEMNALTIVPTSAAVRIADSVAKQLRSVDGIPSLIPTGTNVSDMSQEVQDAYEDCNNTILAKEDYYGDYVSGQLPPDTVFDFEQDFAEIDGKINALKNALNG